MLRSYAVLLFHSVVNVQVPTCPCLCFEVVGWCIWWGFWFDVHIFIYTHKGIEISSLKVLITRVLPLRCLSYFQMWRTPLECNARGRNQTPCLVTCLFRALLCAAIQTVLWVITPGSRPKANLMRYFRGNPCWISRMTANKSADERNCRGTNSVKGSPSAGRQSDTNFG